MKEVLTFTLTFCFLALAPSRSSFSQDNATQSPVVVVEESGNRELDRLNGPVRRVRVEVAKIMPKDGIWVEGPREVLAVTTYEPTGRKIDTLTYPTASNAPAGKEHHVYDDKGNVVEMILRTTDGSILSKESYKYEIDQLGNWTKRSSLVAVYENGRVSFEPTAITYRTISYYYNQAIEKLNPPSPKPKRTLPPDRTSTTLSDSNASSPDSSLSSSPSAPSSATVQLLSEATNAHPAKEPVSAPASVTPAKSDNAASDSPVANSTEIRASINNAPERNVVKQLAEDVLRSAAIELPEPEYSDAALLARASGKVRVQILVDENGNVTNAQATSGHPLLGGPAEAAARKARFALKPSLGATKVYGVLSYDFVPPTSAGEAVRANNPTIDRNPPKPDDRKPEARPIPEGADFAESKPKAPANYSEAARSFYNKGATFHASGRYVEAVEALNQSIRLNPNDAIGYLKLGLAYSGLGRYKEAIVGFKMAASIGREVVDAEGYYRWGHAYDALGKLSDAQDAFKQALYVARAEASDPDGKKATPPLLEEIQYSLGLVYYKAKRYNDAVRELKEAITLNPQLVEAYYVLGLTYIELGNRNSAKRQQEILNSLKSPFADKLAGALLATRADESALRQFKVVN